MTILWSSPIFGARVLTAPLSTLIRNAATGHPSAVGALYSALYRELHAIARRQLRGSDAVLTLGTTTLLHKAYLNMRERDGAQFCDRAHFIAYVARSMRGLLIDDARRQQSKKRGGEFHSTNGDTDRPADAITPDAGAHHAASRVLSV